MKTEGGLQQRMRNHGQPLTIALLVAIAIVSLWTPYAHAEVAVRWFSPPNLLLFAPVPVLVLLATWALWNTLGGDSQAAPFILALLLLFLGYSGLVISLWPNIIPPSVSIWEAAGPPQSMGFTLVGALFIIPFVLAYTAWSYYVFRGKVKAGEGYH
jgi:cytochrome bd ubiquinol oxidase subunit II